MKENGYFRKIYNGVVLKGCQKNKGLNSIGGFWTVLTWEYKGVIANLMDEGYTKRLYFNPDVVKLDVVEKCDGTIEYAVGNEDVLKSVYELIFDEGQVEELESSKLFNEFKEKEQLGYLGISEEQGGFVPFVEIELGESSCCDHIGKITLYYNGDVEFEDVNISAKNIELLSRAISMKCEELRYSVYTGKVAFTNIRVNNGYVYAHAKDYGEDVEMDVVFSLKYCEISYTPKNATTGIRRGFKELVNMYSDKGILEDSVVFDWK